MLYPSTPNEERNTPEHFARFCDRASLYYIFHPSTIFILPHDVYIVNSCIILTCFVEVNEVV